MQKTENDALANYNGDDIRYFLGDDTDTIPAVDFKARAENIIRLADMLQDGARNDAEYAALSKVKNNAENIVQKYDELAQLKAELKAAYGKFREPSDHVRDGDITPTEAAHILSEELANPTGANVDTLVERAKLDGVRYMVGENNPLNNKGIALYTEKQYNNFGWASYNEVITPKEREKLFSLYADYKENRHKYPTTRFGEAVISSSTESLGVIMYIKGPLSNPQITKIVRIESSFEKEIFEIQEEINRNEREHNPQPYEAIEYFYFPEILTISKARDYASFQEYRVESKRDSSENTNTDSRELKFRRGSTEEYQGNDTKLSNESVSRDTHNYRYFLGDDAAELGLGNIVGDGTLDRIMSKAKGAVGVTDTDRNLSNRVLSAIAKYNRVQNRKTRRTEAEAKKAESSKNKKASGKLFYKLKEYTQKQRDNWKDSKRIVIYESEAQFEDFINESLNNKQYDKKMYFGAIPAELASLIKEKTGVDVDGYNCSLSSNEIRKILKDHGSDETELPRGQRAIIEDDFLNIPEVIQSPDSVELSPKKYSGKDAVMFTGEFDTGKMTVVAVVSDKHLDLFVQTAYVGMKKGNLATPTGEQAPINTPKASRGTVSNKTISQPESKVKSKTSKSQTSAKKSKSKTADTVYKKNTKLKVGDTVGEVTLVADSETGDPVTPRLRVSFAREDMLSYIMATVESLGDDQLISALEEEMLLMSSDSDAELQLHDTIEELSDHVRDGEITPEQAAQVLSDELANPTGADVDTLVERAKLDSVKYMVAGDHSLTADSSMLDMAKYFWDMPGADHSNITRETGWWFDDLDGKWKYEISDSEMAYEPNGLVSDGQTLSDYIQHDKLFAAYPQLRDVEVKFADLDKFRKNGMYDPETNVITINHNKSIEQQKKTIIHEIQHAVQEIESFAPGTNKRIASVYLFNEEYKKLKNTSEYKRLLTPDERASYVFDRLYPDESARNRIVNKQYLDSHGEVEARETSERMKNSNIELRNNARKKNTSVVIDKSKVYGEFVDILFEMGYTKDEINLYRKKLGITNDEQRNAFEPYQSELARDDTRGRRGALSTSEKTQSGGRGQTRRVPGRSEPLGGTDTGTDTTVDRERLGGIRYFLGDGNDTVPAIDREARVNTIIALAEGLQSVAQSSMEYEALERYKNNASELVVQYDRLSKLTAEYRDLNNASERDVEKIKSIRQELRKCNNDIDIYESGLKSSRASEPIRDMITRSIRRQGDEISRTKHQYYDRQKQRTQSRKNTETKNKTLKEIKKLRNRLNNPTKSRNVVNGMQEFASRARSC